MKRYKWKKIELADRPLTGPQIIIYDEQTLDIDVPSSAFLYALSCGGLAFNTVRTYASDLTHFLNKVVASPSVREWKNITDEQIRVYLEYDRAEALHPGSLQHVINHLKRFYNWVYENGFLKERKEFSWRLSAETARKLQLNKGALNSGNPPEK